MWLRAITEALLKVSKKWYSVKKLGFAGISHVMEALSTPVPLGGLGVYSDAVSEGSRAQTNTSARSRFCPSACGHVLFVLCLLCGGHRWVVCGGAHPWRP